MFRLIAVTLVILLVAGCAKEEAASSSPQTPTATVQASPAPSPTLTPVPSPSPTPLPPTPSSTPEPSPTFSSGKVILPQGPIPTRSPTPEPGTTLDRKLDSIGLQVSSMRELSAKRPVEREIFTREQMASYVQGLFDEDREEYAKSQRLFVALGIVPAGTDLYQIYLQLYSEAILGVYDANDERFYLVKQDPLKEFGPADERIFAHEFVHGLQQQYFDIRGITDRLKAERNGDAARAFQGIREGDAYLSDLIYTNKFLEPYEQEASEGDISELFLQQFRAAPHVLKRAYVYPFQQGLQFAIDLYRSGGWDAVNQAFVELPASSEQVMHVEKYLAKEEPIVVELQGSVGALGEGWSLLDTGTLGEFFLMSYLEAGSDSAQAAAAAAGWGGDSFVLMQGPDEQTVALISIVWDSEPEAREFYDTFAEFTAARTGTEWTVSEGDESRLMLLPQQAISIRIEAVSTLVLFTPDQAVLEALLQGAEGAGESESGAAGVQANATTTAN